MYHVPRMIVPVRTWQHPQHLVVYSLSRLGLKWCMSSTSVGRNIWRADCGGEILLSINSQRANEEERPPLPWRPARSAHENKPSDGQEKAETPGFDWQRIQPLAAKKLKKGLHIFTLLNIPQRKNVHKLLFVFHLHTPHFFPLHPPLPYQPLHILVHYIHKPPTRQLYLQDPITFLCTFPTHLSLTSLTLSPNSSTWAVPQMRIFPILPILVTHSEILSMFNSATSSSTSRVFCQSYHCLKTIHDSGFH